MKNDAKILKNENENKPLRIIQIQKSTMEKHSLIILLEFWLFINSDGKSSKTKLTLMRPSRLIHFFSALHGKV